MQLLLRSVGNVRNNMLLNTAAENYLPPLCLLSMKARLRVQENISVSFYHHLAGGPAAWAKPGDRGTGQDPCLRATNSAVTQ